MNSISRRIFSIFCAAALLTTSTVTHASNTISDAYIKKISDSYNLDPSWVANQASKATLNPEIITKMNTPWEAKPWHKYQTIFLKQERVDQGLEFWSEHEETLAKAEAEFGVPAQVIVAIIGVETFFGRFKGNEKVLDSLYTLGFHYPKRAKFFSSELGHFLALSHEQGWDPAAIHGSYAGAMGFPQFISSSYRAYAIDFDDDGKRDLLNNPVDAIGSVANYFAQHGWTKDGCVTESVELTEQAKALSQTSTKIKHKWQDFEQAGLKTTLPLSAQDKAMLFPLSMDEGLTQYWLGCNNFYVITRYNHSRLYAMAVYQLSEWLARDKAAQ
ncbi:lytic murein transglycosylase B [Echinimonas agarilytica]|uniref:Lytic murein transglycosylase B n=1 Tax=Echinimonas agarilytica TaxID=1215918 RepID=A0AA41W555_9GAMM|nr:lytic murein transglycosylase B [Echinimonas agarilytica]MCM2679081.1 lytic murein transglycosylase B [Echinimonas agarilytica]